MTKPKLAAQQSDAQRALQAAIDARAEAFRYRDEKREALSRTEAALVELETFLKNAEADLEQEIIEASDDLPGEAAIAVLPDRAVAHAERILRVRQEIELHARLRDKLKADLNAAAMTIKRAIDDLEIAKRPLLQAESARIAQQIDAHEAVSSALRDQLRGMTNASLDGLDCLSARALSMMQGFVPPPPDHPMINSPRWCKQNAWTGAYKAWRKALEADVSASPPEAP